MCPIGWCTSQGSSSALGGYSFAFVTNDNALETPWPPPPINSHGRPLIGRTTIHSKWLPWWCHLSAVRLDGVSAIILKTAITIVHDNRQDHCHGQLWRHQRRVWIRLVRQLRCRKIAIFYRNLHIEGAPVAPARTEVIQVHRFKTNWPCAVSAGAEAVAMVDFVWQPLTV